MEKDSKTETSSETKRSNEFTSDDFCMFAERLRKLEQKMDVQLECAELRAAELGREVSVCEAEQSIDEEWRSAKDLVGHSEGLRQQGVCLAEEEIIDDFLRYWTSPDQLDDVEPCTFVTDNCGVITGITKEDEQSCEAVTSMKKYISEDEYSEVKCNVEECLLTEGSNYAIMMEIVATQEEILVNEEGEDQFKELICDTPVEAVGAPGLQTESLCMNVGIVSDVEVLKECQREISLLEYLLENSEYEREIAEGRVHHSKQENIMGAYGVKRRLVDSLGNSSENSLESLDQHTDVLIEKERNSEQHTEVLAEEGKVLRHYNFCFNNCFMNADFVDDGENLTPLESQIEEEENSMENLNPWDEEIRLLEITLNKQDSIQEGEPQFQNWGL